MVSVRSEIEAQSEPLAATVTPSLGRRGRLRICAATVIALAAIISIPAVFVLVTRGDWLLDIGGEDNWIYIKYFTVWGNPHPELRQVMDQHYKATRVPWILPGYLAYRLLGPLPATY